MQRISCYRENRTEESGLDLKVFQHVTPSRKIQFFKFFILKKLTLSCTGKYGYHSVYQLRFQWPSGSRSRYLKYSNGTEKGWIQNWIRINRIRIRNTIFQSSITRPLLPTRIWSPDLWKTVVKALTHLLLSGNVITTLSTSSPNCSKYVLRVSSVVT